VLVDVHLYLKDVIKDLKSRSKRWMNQQKTSKCFARLYHLQIAMPSSLACGAYAESLDDISNAALL
jgi:hypothetical protein